MRGDVAHDVGSEEVHPSAGGRLVRSRSERVRADHEVGSQRLHRAVDRRRLIGIGGRGIRPPVAPGGRVKPERFGRLVG